MCLEALRDIDMCVWTVIESSARRSDMWRVAKKTMPLAPNFTSAQAGPKCAEASKAPPAISASEVSAK